MSLELDRSTWKRVAFGDVIDSITERVDNPSEAGVERYVGLEHLDPGVMTVQRWDSPDKVEAQKLRFASRDVIFGRRRAYQRKVAMAEFEGICSAHALVLRARSNYVDPAFLPVFLSSDYFLDRAIEISVGSLSPTINWRDLKVQEFDLPPLDQQRRIADLFWAIEGHRLALRSAQESARSLLSHIRAAMFTVRTDETRANELFHITIGRQRSPKHENGDYMVPYLRSANVTAQGIGVGDVKSMNFTPKEQEKFALKAGDVLVSEASASALSVGMPAVWREEIAGVVCFQNTLLRYRAIEGVSVPAFVEHYCHWAFETGGFLSAASGTNIRHIGVGGATSMKLGRSTIAEQRAFVHQASAVNAAIEALNSEQRTLKELVIGLSDEIFGGS
ncbi:restriction endonuclease subunit S [Arthrobacter sp. MSA 4-2]|uniref:restriction endonuclease subunit S n=1 Tax=Arthrobacter sp. MSA 4-2 TaxID=2794349 RepID=UPI0018E7A967|nr:restriction endonuclease subunit S [Arthrobacter sp. MSA 4-2]MBJ2119411.1 restriction endonuclease subunit S [Arthrobacter sp. MSA 4-2]